MDCKQVIRRASVLSAAVTGIVLLRGSVATATLTLSTSTSAPTGADIAQPDFSATSLSGFQDYTNNGNGGSGPGQTFSIASDLSVNSITVKGFGDTTSGGAITGDTFTLTLGSFQGGAFFGNPITVIDQETVSAAHALDAGSKGYLSFTLSTPVVLPAVAGTNYVWMLANSPNNQWFGLAKSSGDVYAGGQAVLDQNASNGYSTDFPQGVDRTFFINGVLGAPPITFGFAIANWVANTSGNWETAPNWSSNPTIPGAVGSQVTFGVPNGTPISHPVVGLSKSANVTLLDFQSPDGASTSGYTLNNTANGDITVSAQLEADSGSHTVNLPMIFSSAVSIYVEPGASLTVPTISNSGQFGTFALTAADGSSTGGTFSEAGMQFCSINVSGTWNILGSMSTSLTSPVEFFGTTVNANSVLNVGGFLINTNSLYGSATATVNIGSGGALTIGYFQGQSFYSGALTGAGGLLVTGLVGSGPSPHTLYGSSPGFSGPITVNGGDTLEVQKNNGMGDGSATNTLTLDNGTLQSIGSWSGGQQIIITANGGTIDTDGPAGGGTVSGTNPLIPGGTAISVGPISSTAAGAQLTKINSGQVTATSIRGVGLTINGGAVRIAPSASKAAGLSILTSLTFQAGNFGINLDLTNNDMIVQGGSISAIAALLAGGFNAHQGYWNGGGAIVSSAAAGDTRFLTALGYRQSPGTAFDGVNTTSNDVLVRYTYYGDADLNGMVDGSDYHQIDLGFASHGLLTGWSNGDFNYDGVVDGTDYALIDNTVNQLAANPTLTNPLALVDGSSNLIASPAAASPVPEPTMLGLLGIGTIGLLGRGRRSAK